ncbi:MAG: endonuclease/exonuclease/phosphatase family protein [Bacteroidales bacterium]|nr:endonuclease/exonuclease/phosphatase family protein [Bacteroidales bacterium]
MLKMWKTGMLAAMALCLLTASQCGKDTPGPGEEPEPPVEMGVALKAATFNIRFATASDTGVKAWSARKDACRSVVERYGFDVFGIQEALAVQQADLRELLPAYTFRFVGRDDGLNGEAVGIAWRSDRFESVEEGRFWLSPTPDVPSGSTDWGGVARHRVAVWNRLKEKDSGREFYFLATHLEVGEDVAAVRTRSAELIIGREAAFNPDGLPVFVVGDMNPVAPTEPAMRTFRTVYVDAWQQAEADGVREGPIGSYNGFNPDANLESQSKRGDYIFYRGAVSLVKYKAVDDKFAGQYPSDHIPVMVFVNL